MKIALPAAAAALFAGAALAQTPFIGDPQAPLVVTGKVLAVEWINPSTRIYVAAKGPDGAAKTYVFRGGTPNTLLRSGLTRAMIAKDTEVTVRGYLDKAGACAEDPHTHIYACPGGGRLITLPSGRTYLLRGLGAGAPSIPADWPYAERPSAGAEAPGARWCEAR